ncbi:unnamed protein product [Adineta steineri]|uniref:Uncharacterized protein n=1 Tax=Adineta steineri TaxID=433720 RepID=A0A818P464_9BILA|nr:unnamed protein product [Adineta steineri]
MESSPRTASIIVNDLEQRLKNLYTTRVHDELTLNNLESLLNECSNQLNRLISSSDSTLVAIILPCLLHTIISLSKICTEKSDIIISGSFLSRDQLNLLMTTTKTLYNQIKEFIKSPNLSTILSKSTERRHFCEQLRLVTDSIANSDIVTTMFCQKLIVKILTGSDDQQQLSQIQMEDTNDGLIVAVYGSVLQQMITISTKSSRDKPDNNRESATVKMYGLYFQMLSRLIQHNNTISEIENYNDFFRTMLHIHACLESTCQQNRFQLEFFNNTIVLQEILYNFISYSLSKSMKSFFDELFQELSLNKNKYASLILLFRIIETFDLILTKQSHDLSIHLINLLITQLFNLIDQCRVQLILPALLPISFTKTQVEYGSLYDITYSLLMKLFNHEPMQTVLSSMNQLVQLSDENNSSILSTSIQLSSELIIQCWFLYNQSLQFQYLYGLFLSELLQLDIHSNLINHLFTMPNIRQVKFYAYEAIISSNTFQHIYNFYSNIYSTKESIINSTNLSLIYPTNINHLYAFIRLFNTELNLNQIQHTMDTCIYSIQQFLSLPFITESTCRNFIIILRLLTYLTNNNMNENLKCLLGQLTQIFIILDEQTAIDVRLELLHVFAIHSNILDDNDLGRLLDFMLTNSIDSNPNSIAFHIGCLDVVDSLRQRQSRSNNITDLIIQLIVRYGNEHQCSNLLKAHLMKIFLAYISNGNDDSLPMKVKSQCILLRASIDEFEKSKKTVGTTNNRFPDENVLKVLDSNHSAIAKDLVTQDHDIQLKFYQTIINELEIQQCSLSTQNLNAMQQD